MDNGKLAIPELFAVRWSQGGFTDDVNKRDRTTLSNTPLHYYTCTCSITKWLQRGSLRDLNEQGTLKEYALTQWAAGPE